MEGDDFTIFFLEKSISLMNRIVNDQNSHNKRRLNFMGVLVLEPQTIFVTISCLVFVLVAFIIPKKVRPYELYVTALFATLLGLLVDSILAIKYKLYVLDRPGVQILPLIGQVIFYSTASIILLNFYPFDKSLQSKIIYIFWFTLFTLAFEFLSFKFGFIKYNEWKIWYSAFSYPLLIYFLLLHYKFFQWLVKRSLKG